MPTWSRTAGRLHRANASRSGRERRLGDRRGDRRADTNAPVDPRRVPRGASPIRGRRGGVATTRRAAARDGSSRRFLARDGWCHSTLDPDALRRTRATPNATHRTRVMIAERDGAPVPLAFGASRARGSPARARRAAVFARVSLRGDRSSRAVFVHFSAGAGENGPTRPRKPARDARATRARAPTMRDPASLRLRRPRRLRSPEDNLSARALFSRAALCARPNCCRSGKLSHADFSSHSKTDARARTCANSHTDFTYGKNVFAALGRYFLDELDLRAGFSPAESRPFAERWHADRTRDGADDGGVADSARVVVARQPFSLPPARSHHVSREASRADDPSREGRSCSLPSRRPRASR